MTEQWSPEQEVRILRAELQNSERAGATRAMEARREALHDVLEMLRQEWRAQLALETSQVRVTSALTIGVLVRRVEIMLLRTMEVQARSSMGAQSVVRFSGALKDLLAGCAAKDACEKADE